MASAVGHIEEYNTGEDIEEYLERIECYFVANEVKEDKRISVMLSVTGPKTYKTLRSITSPAKPTEKTLPQLKELLIKHYNPKPSENVLRFRFNSRSRKEGETINEFLVELRRLGEGCNYGDQLDTMLRDRLVCGVNDPQIQKQLLSQTKLDLQKAIDITTGMDLAAKNAAEMFGASVHGISRRKKKFHFKPSDQSEKRRYCSLNHAREECPAFGTRCKECGKLNHWASVCESVNNPQNKSSDKFKMQLNKSQRKALQIHGIETVDGDDEESLVINAVNSSRGPGSSTTIYLGLRIGGQNMQLRA